MILLRITVFLLFALEYSSSERIRLDAKKLINGKVLANGYSISAKSLSHCLEYCNRRRKTCDGIVFYGVIEKCRLISKCSPAYQVDNTTSAVYYSRRPQITAPGYIYDPKSETCLGLVNVVVNYADADELCRKQNAQLFVVNKKKMNQVAANLLTRSGFKWGWISDKNIAYNATVVPHGVSGNDVLSQEVFSPVVEKRRTNSLKSCWAINNRGQWGEFSCKNDTMVALCQVHQFEL